MTDTSDTPISDDALKMQELCVSLHQLKISRDNARINAANIDIQIKNLNTLIVGTIDDIGRLQRTGLEILGQDRTNAILNERQKPMQVR